MAVRKNGRGAETIAGDSSDKIRHLVIFFGIKHLYIEVDLVGSCIDGHSRKASQSVTRSRETGRKDFQSLYGHIPNDGRRFCLFGEHAEQTGRGGPCIDRRLDKGDILHRADQCAEKTGIVVCRAIEAGSATPSVSMSFVSRTHPSAVKASLSPKKGASSPRLCWEATSQVKSEATGAPIVAVVGFVPVPNK